MLSLAELSDREEIRTLLLTYARCLDELRLEDYAALFARDGVWTGSFGTATGPDGILKLMNAAFEGAPKSDEITSFHIISDMIVDCDGDSGTAWSRWTYYVKGADGLAKIALTGRYEDVLIREDGTWKFLRREAFNDIPAAGPEGPDMGEG